MMTLGHPQHTAAAPMRAFVLPLVDLESHACQPLAGPSLLLENMHLVFQEQRLTRQPPYHQVSIWARDNLSGGGEICPAGMSVLDRSKANPELTEKAR
jgi:hypothetical protein